MGRRLELLLTILLLAGACQPAPDETPTAPATPAVEDNVTAYDITYAATGGQPAVDARLHIAPNGAAELYLGTSASLLQAPLDTVGSFAGTAPATSLRALHAYISQENLLDRSGGALSSFPHTPNRSLSLTAGERSTTITLGDTSGDAVAIEVERMLGAIMAELATQPASAVRVTLDAPQSAGVLRPVITLAQAGSEPLSVLLYDPATANLFIRSTVSLERPVEVPGNPPMWIPVQSRATPREHIAALVGAGSLPSGVAELPVGGSTTIPLPDLTLPAGNDPLYLSAVVSFQMPGAPNGPRMVEVRTPRVLANG
jgi:hypothetical protein